jgi:hypothetical protein
MRRQIDLKPRAHGPENGRKVVHAGIAFGRKHPVQAFAGLGRQRGQLLKAHGVDVPLLATLGSSAKMTRISAYAPIALPRQ